MNVSYPMILSYVCLSGAKKYLFFEKFGMHCFLATSLLRFAITSYYQQFVALKILKKVLARYNATMSFYLPILVSFVKFTLWWKLCIFNFFCFCSFFVVFSFIVGLLNACSSVHSFSYIDCQKKADFWHDRRLIKGLMNYEY